MNAEELEQELRRVYREVEMHDAEDQHRAAKRNGLVAEVTDLEAAIRAVKRVSQRTVET